MTEETNADKIPIDRRAKRIEHTAIYTPSEIVDFINESVKEILKTEFDTDLTDSKVTILDPFTGDGRFLSRLISEGHADKDLDAVYDKMKGWEIRKDAAKEAKQNIEKAYEAKTGKTKAFKGIKRTDTFLEAGSYDTRI